MIYEGTNGIQALDLVGRKLAKDGGRAMMAFFNEVTTYINDTGADQAMLVFRAPLLHFARPPAAGLDVVHAQRGGQARQCRRRRHRLHASVWPGGSWLYVGADRRGGASLICRRRTAPRRA